VLWLDPLRPALAEECDSPGSSVGKQVALAQPVKIVVSAILNYLGRGESR